MNIIEWFKRKLGMLSFALANVEKDMFAQKHSMDSNHTINQQLRQDTLADDLIKGEITQEVTNLRWRTYKVLQHSRGFKTQINIDGSVSTRKIKPNMKKLKLDDKEKYPLEILFKNSDTTISFDEIINELDDSNVIGIEELNSNIKPNSYLSLFRESRPSFKIENYTTKLHIRKYDDNTKLIEFYIPKYPQEFNTKSTLLISKLKKMMEDNKSMDIADIKEVGFSSFQTVGCEDFNEYLYKIDSFLKIIEYNGNYVLKFLGKPIFEHQYMLSDMIEKELDDKYNNNEAKDNDKTLYFDMLKSNNE